MLLYLTKIYSICFQLLIYKCNFCRFRQIIIQKNTGRVFSYSVKRRQVVVEWLVKRWPGPHKLRTWTLYHPDTLNDGFMWLQLKGNCRGKSLKMWAEYSAVPIPSTGGCSPWPPPPLPPSPEGSQASNCLRSLNDFMQVNQPFPLPLYRLPEWGDSRTATKLSSHMLCNLFES